MMGLILTPSSTWAPDGSSDSLWGSTLLPQRVLTKVVRPGEGAVSYGPSMEGDVEVGRRGMDVPVPDAPHTIKQNWIPFLTFFFRRIIFYNSGQVSNGCQ